MTFHGTQLICRFREASVIGVTMAAIETILHRDPDILGGTPVFVGTRVPIRTLFDYLAAGDSLEIFLDHFPTVSREQASEGLKQAFELLVTRERPASRPSLSDPSVGKGVSHV